MMKVLLVIFVAINGIVQSQISISGVVSSGGWMPVRRQSVLPLRKLPDGTSVRDCFSWNSGQRVDGETWIKSNAWKMTCKNGTIEVTACIGTRRANFAEIPIGKTENAGGFWHKCEVTDTQIKYSQERSCLIDGKELHINDTFRNGAFKMKCESWGYSIAGCYYYTKGGKLQELAIGGSKDEGILRHMCEKMEDSGNRVKYSVHATACEKNGKVYKENETWIEGHLKYKCLKDGETTAIGCVMSNGREIAIGDHIIVNNTVHQCYRLGRTTYYYSFACGFRGVPCAPKSVPSTTFTGTSSVQVVERTLIRGGGGGVQGLPANCCPPSSSVSIQPAQNQVVIGSSIGFFIPGITSTSSSGTTLRVISKQQR